MFELSSYILLRIKTIENLKNVKENVKIILFKFIQTFFWEIKWWLTGNNNQKYQMLVI